MNRRPDDRRGHITQATIRSPPRYAKRRASPRARDTGRPPPLLRDLHFENGNKQIGNGAHCDDMRRVRPLVAERDAGLNYNRKPIRREPSPFASRPPPPIERIREGIVFEYMNYYEFLRDWIEESNRVILRRNRNAEPKRVQETITQTTRAERERIILPVGVFDREELLHCDMIIGGLPPSVFFGSGFGNKPSLAKAAAAKDLVDKCHRVGLITGELHASIGNHPDFRKRDIPLKDYDLAVDAVLDLDRKMSVGRWPWDLNTARELEPDTLDRLKAVFNSVLEDVYLSRGHRERPHGGLPPPPMVSRAPATPAFVDNREKTEFCRRCKLYGHSERHCENGRGRSRERIPPRISPPPLGPHMTHPDERGRRGERFEQRKVIDEQFQYTPDEIERKIARQREELLRQEMMLRESETSGSWLSNGGAPQPLFPPALPRGEPMGYRVPSPLKTTSIAPFVEPLTVSQPLGADDLRAKLEAKAQKLDEEKRLKQKEEELERRMQQELEEKKRIMEEEIRRQVQFEERARIQMELAQAQHQTIPMVEQGYSAPSLQSRPSSSYVFPAALSSAFGYSSTLNRSAVNDPFSSISDFEVEEIKRLVKETEEKLVELQRNCRESELAPIFQSRAFQMVSELGDNAHMLDRAQRQTLLCELKDILSQAERKSREKKEGGRRRSRSRSRNRGLRRGSSRDRRELLSRSRSRSPRHRDSHGRSRGRDFFKEVRVKVGNVTLRSLSEIEQRHLNVGEVVVAQDLKTGKWSTARIAKVSGGKATLSLGNTTWKKHVNELYKEVPEEWAS